MSSSPATDAKAAIILKTTSIDCTQTLDDAGVLASIGSERALLRSLQNAR